MTHPEHRGRSVSSRRRFLTTAAASGTVLAGAPALAGNPAVLDPDPVSLVNITLNGSSPLVEYDGEGIYFLDRIRPGVWRLPRRWRERSRLRSQRPRRLSPSP